MKSLVPVVLAVLFSLVLAVGLGVTARMLAYGYGVPGLVGLALACAGIALVAVRAVRRRRGSSVTPAV